jgi:hypothetical protein
MKFNVSDIEIKNILEMHSKMKKNNSVIVEQVTPTTVSPEETKLRDAIKAGCLSNGMLKRKKSTGQVFYRKSSVKNPSVEVDFFGDMTYKLSDGSKTGKWKCDKIADIEANVTDIEREKTQGGWKERKDIVATDAEINSLYEKHPKYNLYKLKADKGQFLNGLTPEQTAFIEDWKKLGAKETLTPEDRAKNIYTYKIVPGSEQVFNGGLKMWLSPENVKNAAVTTSAKASRLAQTTDIKDCKEAIEEYFLDFKQKNTLSSSEFNTLKAKVQACKNQHKGKWSKLGILDGGNKIDKYLDILSGNLGGSDGPPSYGPGSEWRLN